MKNCLLGLCLVITACGNPSQVATDAYSHIGDLKVKGILQESIEHYGGLERWGSVAALSYDKDFDLLLENGEIEKSYKQLHDYNLDPLDIKISSKENDQTILTTLTNGKYARAIEGKKTTADPSALAKSINTSLYVIGIPYKLLDPGVALSYEGEREMEDGRVVDIIRASYDADQHANHSSTDIWEYYFDKKERMIVANWVQTSDHSNIVENLSFERVEGLLMNKERKSYRLDSMNRKTFLRAAYTYGNYRIELK